MCIEVNANARKTFKSIYFLFNFQVNWEEESVNLKKSMLEGVFDFWQGVTKV